MVNKLKILLAAFSIAISMGAWPSGGRFPNCPTIGNGTFYVSSVGSDRYPGTGKQCPWKTIAHVNAHTFAANSTVLFAGGQTFSGGLVLTTGVTPGLFTINSYGSGQATISSGNSECIKATNVPNITIHNIVCVGSGALISATDGIRIVSTSALLAGPTITNSTVSGYGHGCILVQRESGGGGHGLNNVTINNNITHDCTGNYTLTPNSDDVGISCIQVGNGFGLVPGDNTNITITNNQAYNCNGIANVSNNVPTGFGILVTNSAAVLVANNLAHDNGSLSTTAAGPVGIIFQTVNNGVISFNEVFNTGSPGGSNSDGEGIDLDQGVSNSIVEYNFVHGNSHGELLVGDFGFVANSNNIFRFNILQTTKINVSGLLIQANSFGTTNLQIYNNTFILTNTGDFCIGGGAVNNTQVLTVNISNNICYGLGALNASIILQAGNTPIVITGNDYFSDSGTFPHFSPDGGSTFYNSLAAMHTAGYEKVGASNVGTVANPTVAGVSLLAASCGGYSTTCPPEFLLKSSSTLLSPAGLNLNTDYGFVVGSQDFFGNAVTASTLPIGASEGIGTPSNRTSGAGDIFPGAYAWWGLRCYDDTSAGNVADVWDAATGNTTETLITCSPGRTLNYTINPIATTCASGCKIKTLYDQSRQLNCNGPCDVTQATNSQRPAYTQSCIGSFACATYTRASSQVLTSANVSTGNAAQPFSVATVAEATLVSSTTLGYLTQDGWEVGYNDPTANTAWVFAGSAVQSITANDNVFHAVHSVVGTSPPIIFLDGADNTTGSAGTSGIANAQAFSVGGTTDFFNGPIVEMGVWPFASSVLQRSALCHNQNIYYSLGLSC